MIKIVRTIFASAFAAATGAMLLVVPAETSQASIPVYEVNSNTQPLRLDHTCEVVADDYNSNYDKRLQGVACADIWVSRQGVGAANVWSVVQTYCQHPNGVEVPCYSILATSWIVKNSGNTTYSTIEGCGDGAPACTNIRLQTKSPSWSDDTRYVKPGNNCDEYWADAIGPGIQFSSATVLPQGPNVGGAHFKICITD